MNSGVEKEIKQLKAESLELDKAQGLKEEKSEKKRAPDLKRK